MKKDYRKYYRIFLTLFLLSFGANLFVLALYLKERLSWPSFLRGDREARKVTLGKGTVPISLVSRGWYPSLSGLNIYNGMGKEFSIKQRDRLILHKDGKRVAVFNILVRDPIPFELEAGS